MKTIIPLNLVSKTEIFSEGHKRFILAKPTHTTKARITYTDPSVKFPVTRTEIHPANREIKKDDIAEIGGNSLNALKGGRCTPHGIFSTSRTYARDLT